MKNAPTELELLRAVASAAHWAIASNADDVVGRDGRSRVGLNWVAANGALNKALHALREHHGIVDLHSEQRAEVAELEQAMRPKKRAK